MSTQCHRVFLGVRWVGRIALSLFLFLVFQAQSPPTSTKTTDGTLVQEKETSLSRQETKESLSLQKALDALNQALQAFQKGQEEASSSESKRDKPVVLTKNQEQWFREKLQGPMGSVQKPLVMPIIPNSALPPAPKNISIAPFSFPTPSEQQSSSPTESSHLSPSTISASPPTPQNPSTVPSSASPSNPPTGFPFSNAPSPEEKKKEVERKNTLFLMQSLTSKDLQFRAQKLLKDTLATMVDFKTKHVCFFVNTPPAEAFLTYIKKYDYVQNGLQNKSDPIRESVFTSFIDPLFSNAGQDCGTELESIASMYHYNPYSVLLCEGGTAKTAAQLCNSGIIIPKATWQDILMKYGINPVPCTSLCTSALTMSALLLGDLGSRNALSLNDLSALSTQIDHLQKTVHDSMTAIQEGGSNLSEEAKCTLAVQLARKMPPFQGLPEKERKRFYTLLTAQLGSQEQGLLSRCTPLLATHGADFQLGLRFLTDQEIITQMETQDNGAIDQKNLLSAVGAQGVIQGFQGEINQMQQEMDQAQESFGPSFSSLMTLQGCPALLAEKSLLPSSLQNFCPSSKDLPSCLGLSQDEQGALTQSGILDPGLMTSLRDQLKGMAQRLASLSSQLQGISSSTSDAVAQSAEKGLLPTLQDYQKLRAHLRDYLLNQPLKQYQGVLQSLMESGSPLCSASNRKSCHTCLLTIAKTLRMYLHKIFSTDVQLMEDSMGPSSWKPLEQEIERFELKPVALRDISDLLLLKEVNTFYQQCKTTPRSYDNKCIPITTFKDIVDCFRALKGVGALFLSYQYVLNKLACDNPQAQSVADVLNQQATSHQPYLDYLVQYFTEPDIGKTKEQITSLAQWKNTLNTFLKAAVPGCSHCFDLANCSNTQCTQNQTLVNFSKFFGSSYPSGSYPDNLQTPTYFFQTLLIPNWQVDKVSGKKQIVTLFQPKGISQSDLGVPVFVLPQGAPPPSPSPPLPPLWFDTLKTAYQAIKQVVEKSKEQQINYIVACLQKVSVLPSPLDPSICPGIISSLLTQKNCTDPRIAWNDKGELAGIYCYTENASNSFHREILSCVNKGKSCSSSDLSATAQACFAPCLSNDELALFPFSPDTLHKNFFDPDVSDGNDSSCQASMGITSSLLQQKTFFGGPGNIDSSVRVDLIQKIESSLSSSSDAPYDPEYLFKVQGAAKEQACAPYRSTQK